MAPIEKSEMVQYLEAAQTRHLLSFNKAVIRQCGVVVGFLERPIDNEEMRQHFLSCDVVLNMTDEYFSNKGIFFIITELILVVLLPCYVFR